VDREEKKVGKRNIWYQSFEGVFFDNVLRQVLSLQFFRRRSPTSAQQRIACQNDKQPSQHALVCIAG